MVGEAAEDRRALRLLCPGQAAGRQTANYLFEAVGRDQRYLRSVMPPDRAILARLTARARGEAELARFRSGYAVSRTALANIARSKKPLVVGPFLSEVGFECLYWVPMLRWFTESYGIDIERVTAFSRGGPTDWYAGVAHRYVDVFDYLSPLELKALQAARVARTRNEKQLSIGREESALLSSAGLSEDFDLLDPSVMYSLFWAVWSLRRPVSRVLKHTQFHLFDDASEQIGATHSLPSSYVAVKPYFSSCFPDSTANRAFLAALLRRLSESVHVVLLSTGIDLDGHEDYLASSERITDISGLVEPRDNLGVQTAVLRGAAALYTTYGGFAHLGPFLGVPTFAFHSEHNFNPVHLDVMRRAVAELRLSSNAGFILLDVRDLSLLDGLARLAHRGTPIAPSPR